MATLIVEERGKRRRFRLKDGKLTVGSGAGCTLVLESDDVAEVHAELELARGSATLRLRRGVAPVVVEGRPVSGELTLAHGVPVRVGSAVLRVEYEDAGGTSLVDRRQKASRAEAAAPARTPAIQTTTPQIRRRRKTVKRGLPTWATLLILAAAIFVAYRFFVASVETTAEQHFVARAVHERATTCLREGDFIGAEKELARAEGEDLSPEWSEKFADLRRELDRVRTEAELEVVNQRGTVYLEQQLKRFESTRLASSPESPEVRVFLKRLAYFKETWPQHPERDWAERMESRYSKIVDLSVPPSYEDVEFEVESLTWAKPRYYDEAFRILQAFIDGSEGTERDQALALLDAKMRERDEHHAELLLQAKYDWNKGEQGAAVGWLVSLVLYIADGEKENEAASILVQLEGIEGWLRGYRTQQPEKFARLAENPIIARKLEEMGEP